jgi:FkbM family methyltransferase
MSMLSQAAARLQLLMDQPLPEGQPLPPKGSEFVIYGAGNCGRDVMKVLWEHGYGVEAFIDIRANSISAIDGVRCLAPDSETARAYARSGVPVVMAVFNPAVDMSAVHEVLNRCGFKHIVSYYELFEWFPKNLSSRFWLAPRQLYEDQRKEIVDGFKLWEDDVSRRIYIDLLELRLTWNLELLRQPDTEYQYFPRDLPSPRTPMRLIDGGAFVGDSMQCFLNHNLKIEAVAAFEPDAANFRRLREFANRHRDEICSAVLFPCGVSDQMAMLKFLTGRGAGSNLSDEGNEIIQVVTIDDVIPSFAPTLIKLDVEGAELAALNGAAETIRRYEPDLAICVYHLPDHLWKVPLLMHELAPNHHLALRYHQFNDFDVVAYAFRH